MSVLLLLLLVVVKYLVVTPLGHVLEFSPGGLYAHIGETEVEIPWDSITGIEVYRGHGLGRDDGIELHLTERAPLPLVLCHRRGRRGHPLHRQLRRPLTPRDQTSFREGRCLFVGPPRDVRRSMRRSQVWLPWERGVHAALNPDAPRTPDA